MPLFILPSSQKFACCSNVIPSILLMTFLFGVLIINSTMIDFKLIQILVWLPDFDY